MHTLFIPFSVDEEGYDLFLMGTTWRKNIEETGKLDKMPKIVMYPGEEEDVTNISDDLSYMFRDEDINANDAIYILSQGMDSEDEVAANQSETENCFLKIQDVAARMKKCGFTPEIAKKINSLKLYICGGEKHRNHQLAISFAKALGEEYKDLTIHYYEKLVYIPKKYIHGTIELFHKIAKNTEDAKEIFRASEVRKTIKVSESSIFFTNTKRKQTEITNEEVREIEAKVIRIE
ncbi:hypothetical protein [Legionella brunensis]|uniref:Uncharacterized protein n=1 Tax=Legionella brunensis TaxID=29422 RepID=A0A0W0SLS3_9GAMM|nr:hypothetical protein [Legionella brunensis]KTC84212.1 hypothetical protein Lbru_1573 [Legionella brunensis]